MHRFAFKNNKLYCETISVERAAKQFGTPLYLYSLGTVMDHFNKIKEAFKPMDPLICFSMKANSNLAIISSLVKSGAGLDIVSGGELYLALKAGCPPGKIVYASVGKKPEEIKDAIRKRIFLFNVESEPELAMINKIARSEKRVVSVALRVNPDVSAHSHKYITTGTAENKFGLDFEAVIKIFKNRDRFRNLRIKGLHIHIGSQITQSEPFIKALAKILKFIDSLELAPEYMNIGGGLGIIYSKEKPQTAEDFAKKIIPLFKGRDLKLILEPGRFVVGNSGVLVTKVIYIKKNFSGKSFAIVDAGMNDLIRPSLYEAYHEINPVVKRSGKTYSYDIVGPICESGDFLGKDRTFAGLRQGDYLAVMGAGAYGFSMSSNYNSRPRLPEVIVSKGKMHLARRRESYGDLLRGQKIQR